jgi:TadE-like protein
VARYKYALFRGPGHGVRNHRTRDEGAILVFWALCLPLLLGLAVGVLQLGNLVQSRDNAQDSAYDNAQNTADAAADTAAVAAANYLATNHPNGAMVVNLVPIDCQQPNQHSNQPGPPTPCRCNVDGQDAITGCANYQWLNGYSIYEGDQWEAIGGSQVSFAQALSDPAGTWTCQSRYRRSQHCAELNVYPPGPDYGVNGSVSNGETISQAIVATNAAVSVEEQNGISYSGCTPPPDFLLAEGPEGVSCIGYDAAGTIWVVAREPFTLPGFGAQIAQKTAFATESGGQGVLCSGPPPSGACQ